MNVTKVNEKRIEVIKKRIEHLRARIRGNAHLSFDKAELAALEWAVRIVTRYLSQWSK